MFIRRLPKFTYLAPTSIREATGLKEKYGEKASVYAGGTDLFVAMKKRDRVPEYLINLKGIPGLKGIRLDNQESITIGGLTTLGDIQHSKIIQEMLPVLWDAVHVMGSVQIRNLGTLGGNLCSAWPSADSAPPLVALGSAAKLMGNKGERMMPVEDFFQGPGQSAIQPDEILTEITIPCPPENSNGAYIKLMRRSAMDLSIAGAAAYLKLDADKRMCTDVRIALGAVAPTPIRAPEAEKILMNQEFDENLAREAGRIASKNINPRDSIRASGEYRKSAIKALVKKALLKAFERI
ncbi:MAG: FAD binding domain-containing protein [Desulfobacteraceae bacterium]|jgi:carbon-monoxide dehydrogenase medium subunit